MQEIRDFGVPALLVVQLGVIWRALGKMEQALKDLPCRDPARRPPECDDAAD